IVGLLAVLSAIIVIAGGESERGLEGVALEIGDRAADSLDAVLVTAIVVIGGEFVPDGMAFPVRYDAGDADLPAFGHRLISIGKAVLAQDGVDDAGDFGQVFVPVIGATLSAGEI